MRFRGWLEAPSGTVEPGQSGPPEVAGGPRPPVRILSNTHWLDGYTIRRRRAFVEHVFKRPTIAEFIRVRPWCCDAAMMNINTRWVLALCAMKWLMPWLRLRVLALDLVLTRPHGFSERCRFWIRRWLLKKVDRFVFYFRDTAELRRLYGISAARVKYIPFKPNTLEKLQAISTSEEGFVLACGRSNRDYGLLCEAMRDLPWTCNILVSRSDAAEHGTALDGISPPDNVRFVSDDGSVESWNTWIARSSAVVIPIRSGVLAPSGIGTYLVAMALGKAVIMTEGPATRGLLSEETAALVPAGDARSLREAIRLVLGDRTMRDRLAQAGQRYALSLGGEERLHRDVGASLEDLLGT